MLDHVEIPLDLPPHTRVLDLYRAVRRDTERLAAPLSAEDQTIQSMPDASPTKWHRAHMTWFFETFLLIPHLPGYRVFDSAFGYIFNSYYVAVGPRHPRPSRGLLSRPGVEAVSAYRRARIYCRPKVACYQRIYLGLI